MKIERVTIWSCDVALNAPFGLSGNRVATELTTLIVRIDADGVSGWGESCPWGRDYLPSFAEAVRAGLTVLGPELIGRDAANLADINAFVTSNLMGQPSVLTAIDMACCDLAVRATGVPMWQFLGGRLTLDAPLPGGIGQTPGPEMQKKIEAWRAKGVRQMSAKADGNVDEDVAMVRFILERLEPGEFLKVDANGGWRLDHALRVAEVMDHRVMIEQPCGTYAECRSFSERSGRAIYLDEIATGSDVILRAHGDGILAGVNLKIAKLGGLTQTRQVRDLCTDLGIPVFIQDTGGCAIARAGIVHMAAAIPERLLNGVWDCAAVMSDALGTGGVIVNDASLRAADTPGLGVEMNMASLGEPVAIFGAAPSA